jgi:hypothetical protein
MPDTAAKERDKPTGRRGGRVFPQYPLSAAVKWADKLVSKTHNGPQPDDLIRAGVVEAKYTAGNTRISALKQFDLMEGTSKGYTATELAKELRAAPENEKGPLYARAALSPDVFNAIYETYQGDSVPVAKLKQRAADLKVHPDATTRCAEVYIETMEFAGLVSRNGDLLVHVGKTATVPPSDDQNDDEADGADDNQEPPSNDEPVDNPQEVGATTRRGVATVQVNINLDSSLDTEKLQKQLELLRRYGAL